VISFFYRHPTRAVLQKTLEFFCCYGRESSCFCAISSLLLHNFSIAGAYRPGLGFIGVHMSATSALVKSRFPSFFLTLLALALPISSSYSEVSQHGTVTRLAACSSIGGGASTGYPEVHDGSCIGDFPYVLPLEATGGRVCTVYKHFSCIHSQRVVCIRSLSCAGDPPPPKDCAEVTAPAT
jgi:hypothetical protein